MNEILKKSSEIFYNMLSDFGKRIYMPKGIIVQTAEAKQKAKNDEAGYLPVFWNPCESRVL